MTLVKLVDPAGSCLSASAVAVITSQEPPHVVVSQSDGRLWSVISSPTSRGQAAAFGKEGFEPSRIDGLWQLRHASFPDLSPPPFCRDRGGNPFGLAAHSDATRHILHALLTDRDPLKEFLDRVESAISRHASCGADSPDVRRRVADYRTWLEVAGVVPSPAHVRRVRSSVLVDVSRARGALAELLAMDSGGGDMGEAVAVLWELTRDGRECAETVSSSVALLEKRAHRSRNKTAKKGATA